MLECLPSNATFRLKKLLEEIRQYQKSFVRKILMFISIIMSFFFVYISIAEGEREVLKFLC
jgi:hypothetical protein